MSETTKPPSTEKTKKRIKWKFLIVLMEVSVSSILSHDKAQKWKSYCFSPPQNAKSSRFCKITHSGKFELASSDMRKFHFPFPLSTRVECSCLVNYTCPIDKRRTHTHPPPSKNDKFHLPGRPFVNDFNLRGNTITEKISNNFPCENLCRRLAGVCTEWRTSFAKENLSISLNSPLFPPHQATEQNCRN